MEYLNEYIEGARSVASDAVAQFYAKIHHSEPKTFEHYVKQYFDAISTTSKEEILYDLRNFKITPATATLALITVPTLVLASRLVSGSKNSSNAASESKPKKKKQTKAQKANKEIQRILDFVEETYVPQIDSYIENYADLSADDQSYKYKYFEEMLLKELMNLDNVDVIGNEVLRDNRRKVIRFVQDHQKRLDTFKKENL